MRGSEIVAPEIGNREQIELLQRIERASIQRERDARRGELKTHCYVEDVRARLMCQFLCICGNEIKEKDDVWVNNLDEIDFDFDTISCPVCRRKYQITDGKARLL